MHTNEQPRTTGQRQVRGFNFCGGGFGDTHYSFCDDHFVVSVLMGERRKRDEEMMGKEEKKTVIGGDDDGGTRVYYLLLLL